MTEIKDAAHAKQLIARNLLGSSGHQIVVSEIERFNKPDILSVTRTSKLVEYEIKLSRADLMGELNSVKKIKLLKILSSQNPQGPQQMQIGDKTINASFRGNIFDPNNIQADIEKIGRCSKLDKHDRYLNPRPSERNAMGYYDQPYRPNRFYFAVTSDLVELAVEVCTGLPYGVINLNAIYGSDSIKKRAGILHGEEPTSADIFHMAHCQSLTYWQGNRS